MINNPTIKKVKALIDKLEESESQFERAKISQTIKFILDDSLETTKASTNKETDSSRIDAYIPISEIITSLFVVSNYDVNDGPVFFSHLDFLQRVFRNLEFWGQHRMTLV